MRSLSDKTLILMILIFLQLIIIKIKDQFVIIFEIKHIITSSKMDKILIITGGSKGIGKGIVETYIEQNYKIFSISRSRINDEKVKKIFQIQHDLSDLDSIELIMKEIFEKIKTTPESITLINNAATLAILVLWKIITGRIFNKQLTLI